MGSLIQCEDTASAIYQLHFVSFAQSQKNPVSVSESFCKSGKFLWQVLFWLKNFQILCNTKYRDDMQSVQKNWKVSGRS